MLNKEKQFQLVKEVEQLMSEKNLNNLEILWKKFGNNNDNDNNEISNEKYQNEEQNSLEFRFKLNSKLWVPPNFAKLPVLEYDSKSSSKVFSMAYNEEKLNHSSPNVNKFY